MPDDEPVTPGQNPLPSRAVVISLVVHALIVLALVFGWPYLHHAPADLAAEKPIAITMMASPDEPAEADAPDTAAAGAAAAAPQPAPQVVSPAPVAPNSPPAYEALPYDPSFNPFATAAPSEVQESAQTESAVAAPPSAQAGETGQAGPALDGGDGIDQLGDAGVPGGGAHGKLQSGNAGDDSRLNPQFLRIQLRGYVSVLYANQLHRFLQRLINCGVIPIPSSNPNLSVEADVTFTPAGTLQSAHLTNQSIYGADPGYQKAAGELMNALGRASCSYIRLPPLAYPAWQSVHLSFFQDLPGR